MKLAIIIEGQNGINWPRWKRIVRTVEDAGFAALYRSDHFIGSQPPDQDSLELWISLAWLADNTSRIAFGPLVTPLSFRHPVMTARQARDVDDLSGGRLVLGLGAGWQEREHAHYGFDLLTMKERFARFKEGLEVITRLYREEEPVTFTGKYYQLVEATLLPRPGRAGGPPILIGGSGPIRTLPLVARYADMWNALHVPPDVYREQSSRLDDLLAKAGREPSSIRDRSLMTGLFYGETDAEVTRRLNGRDRDAFAARGDVIGTPGEALDQLAVYADAGVDTLVMRWIDHDDMDGLESFAAHVMNKLG